MIVTPRLVLRPLTADDAPAIVAGVSDFEVATWLTTVPHPYVLEDARRFIESVATRPYHWAITQGGTFAGIISIGDELGYWLARDAWGQGFASEAAFAVTERWFADPSHEVLHAGHFDGNEASARVLVRLGFNYIGARRRVSRSRGMPVPGQDMRLTRERWLERRSLPELWTARLHTRPFAAGDAARLAAIAGLPEVARNTSSIPAPWDEAGARAWIDAGRWQSSPGFRLALCGRDGDLIGIAGLSPMNEQGAASVAYLVEKSHWGRGIASEIMTAFVPAAFRAFPLTALTADHYTDNPASGRVLRKLGFEQVGEGTGTSLARLEPAPVSIYRLERSSFEARS